MRPRPQNRHLLVEVMKEEPKEESSILLPEDYTQKSAFVQARVLALAEDCSQPLVRGDIVIFHSSMLQEIQITNLNFQMVLENHVMCAL